MEPKHEERRLTTILAADVVGYSRLMAADEPGTLAQLKTHRKELLEPKTAEYHGRVVKLMGDGTLMEFTSVVDAVRFGVDVQRMMAARNAGVPEDRRIVYRIGINIGDIIVEGEDIYGVGVNVAARLEGLAEPGGICVSRTVFNHVKTKVDFSFEDLGEQKLKNIAEPIQVFRIGTDDGTLRQATPIPATEDLPLPQKPSIAILPFKNLSGDPSQDYLADGIRLAITAMLVKLSGLFLIAPPTVNTYRGKDVSAERVGREVGVRCVLDGAVQRTGDRIRITVQLTDTVAREVSWAEQYDRHLTDILATQDEITAEVVTALDVKLVSGEDTRSIRSTLKNLEALDAFYRGLSHFYIRTKDDNIAARKLFERVSRLQPDSPAGPTYLCFTHWLDAFMGWTDTKNQSLMQAVSWADKALKYEGTNGLAHIVMAYTHLINHRHDEALDACHQAVKLRPNCPAANSYLATVMHYCGQSAEAVSQIKQAMRITPVYPPWFLTLLAAAYRECGEVGKSISTAEHCLRLNPKNVDAQVILCTDYSLSGWPQKAQETAQEILRIEPTFSVAKYLESQPYQNEEILNGLTESLAQAGLPG